MIKSLSNIFLAVCFLAITLSVQAYEHVQVNMNKNLFEQYISAYDNGVAICPASYDPKVKNILQREFEEYLKKAK